MQENRELPTNSQEVDEDAIPTVPQDAIAQRKLLLTFVLFLTRPAEALSLSGVQIHKIFITW